MEAFALYLLKSVIWLAGFALIFFLFLRNERFFLLNRLYLVAGILSSFFFPMISIHYTVALPVIRNFQTESAIVSEIQNAGNSIIPDIKLLLFVLYVSGVLFVFTLIIRQGRSLLSAIKKSEIISLHPMKLIKTPDYTSAFSFFSYVFVNPSITDVETKEIMNHELAHIRQKHWFDLLLVELLCMMQWFNPLVWIYVRFIRQNHEYLADEVALQRTSDPAVYRAVLLNQIVGAPVVSLANSFNYSLNKKRFNMMKNIISSPYRKLKILLILPVFAIVLYAFAKPDYRYKSADESSGNNITGISSLQKSVKGTVVQRDRKPLEGAAVILKGTTIGTISDVNGNFKLDNVPDDGVLVVTFVGFKSKVLKAVFTSDMTITLMRDTVKYMNLNIDTPPQPPPPPPPPPAMNDVSNINTNDTPPPPPPSLSEKATEATSAVKEIPAVPQTEKEKYVVVESYPEFPGGKDAMATWITANIKYPAEALKGKIEGKVYISFTVNASGKVKDAVITKSASPSLNAEAIRVISSLPDWKPGSQAGKPVDVQIKVPVEFKLK